MPGCLLKIILADILSAKAVHLSVGITLDKYAAKINNKILGGYKNDFSKTCKRTKEPRG
jgi:hypothetical protein